MNLRDMLKLANKLKRSALATHPRIGVTVIVHSAVLSNDTRIAVASTLPSRGHQRALFGEALAQSVIADGGSVDDVGDIAVNDYLESTGVKPS